VLTFLIGAFGLGWPLLTLVTVTGVATVPLSIAFTYVALLGSTVVATWLADGPSGVRHLLRRLLVWRFGFGRWAVILLGMPGLRARC
jgi:hypothetical protein